MKDGYNIPFKVLQPNEIFAEMIVNGLIGQMAKEVKEQKEYFEKQFGHGTTKKRRAEDRSK